MCQKPRGFRKYVGRGPPIGCLYHGGPRRTALRKPSDSQERANEAGILQKARSLQEYVGNSAVDQARSARRRSGDEAWEDARHREDRLLSCHMSRERLPEGRAARTKPECFRKEGAYKNTSKGPGWLRISLDHPEAKRNSANTESRTGIGLSKCEPSASVGLAGIGGTGTESSLHVDPVRCMLLASSETDKEALTERQPRSSG